ncbi:MAG: MoaD/ThiS family protein [Euzebya sp.]
MSTIRVVLPQHLRTLAEVGKETTVEVGDTPTIGEVLDALEACHPVLRGTIRDHTTHKRRAFMRYFACEEDLSHEPPDTVLPEQVVAGQEVFRILGAIAGG